MPQFSASSRANVSACASIASAMRSRMRERSCGVVALQPSKARLAASTAFWVDPVEEQIVIFLTQLMPSSTYPLRRELRVLTYGAIVD